MSLFKRMGLLSLSHKKGQHGWQQTSKEVKISALTDLQRLMSPQLTSAHKIIAAAEGNLFLFDGKSLELISKWQHPTDLFENILLWDEQVLCLGPSPSISALVF